MMCLEVLKQSGFLPEVPSPIDIETFVETHFGAKLDFASEMGEGVLGWTIFGQSGEILMVGVDPVLANDTGTAGTRRCRATVAHEAGHCLMHSILFMEDKTRSLAENLDFQKSRILCRKGDFTGAYDGRWWELQANKAIGEFLMPRTLVRAAVEGFLSVKGSLGIEVISDQKREEAVQHLADTFEGNLTPAKIRLEKIFPPDEGNLL